MSASGDDGASAIGWESSSGGTSQPLLDFEYPNLTLWEGVQLAAVPTGSDLEIAAPPLPWEPSPPDGGIGP